MADGDDVVGSRPDGWWRDRAGAKRRLVERLEHFAAAREVPVTLVFDGRAIAAGGGGDRWCSRGDRQAVQRSS